MAWLAPTLPAAAFVALAAWSWLKWTDPVVDAGHELVVPWHISQGGVLYRDLRYLYGPLSPHVNALLFAIFGASLRTLILANLAFLAATATLVYRLAAGLRGRMTASACTLVFLCVFAFSQYQKTANFNFVTPYVHETTHGTLLLLALITMAQRYNVRRTTTSAAGAGLCLGLSLLTKPEIILAALATCAVGGLMIRHSPERAAPRRRPLAAFALGVLLPNLAFLIYFAARSSTGEAVRAVLGAWSPVLFTEGSRTAYFARGMGVDAPGARLLEALSMFGLIAAVAAVAVALDLALGRFMLRHSRRATVCMAVAALFAAQVLPIPWSTIPRGFGLALAALAVGLFVTAWRVRHEHDRMRSLSPQAMVVACALAMLAKMALNIRISHYGYFLAMPATLVLVAFALDVLPAMLDRRGGGALLRGLSAGVIAAGVVHHVRASHEVYRHKTLGVGTGADRMLAFDPAFDPAPAAMEEARRWIVAHTAPTATLLVLPEGSTLNFLTHRPLPGRYHQFTPTEVLGFGEDAILSDMQQAPPAFIALVHRETGEFGFDYFGEDPRFGSRIMDWVQEQYIIVHLIGAMPLRERQFGIAILQRKSDHVQPS